jgi:micrococcal nuclease
LIAGMSIRTAALGLALVALLAVAVQHTDLLGGGDSAGLDVAPGQRLAARVIRVVDGDTIVVRTRGRVAKVRYIGMDTPESVKPDTPVQCYAKAASHRNSQLVSGHDVTLVVGAEPHDRYGRLLAYVYVAPTGGMVNATLLREGYARTLTIAPNDRLAAQFAELQKEAQSAPRGIWSHC